MWESYFFSEKKMIKSMGSIRVVIELKFWDPIHINELFFSEKNDKKWWNIKMKIEFKMVKNG